MRKKMERKNRVPTNTTLSTETTKTPHLTTMGELREILDYCDRKGHTVVVFTV